MIVGEKMTIASGEKVFILRYNDNYIQNAMEYHKEICDREGFCWYGKAGKKPSMEKLCQFVEGGKTKILFYNKKDMYIGNLLDVSSDMPQNGFPDYYIKSMWKPNSWYMVSGLEKISRNCLGNLIVISTKKTMAETINSSMTSFYFTVADRIIELRRDENA